MPKSGKKASPGKKQKPQKPTAKCLLTAPGDSPPSLPENPKPDTALLAPAEARVARALWKLGISREDWENSPEITPIIWEALGEQKSAVARLRFSDDPGCRKFLKVYGELTKDEQEHLPLEIPCLAAGVSPSHILGQMIVHAKFVSQAASGLVLMTQNPKVLKATADYGIALPQNVKDREMILRSTRTLPTPQGGGINIFVGDRDQDDGPDVDPEDSTLESDVFDYDTKTIDGWGDQRRRLMDEDKRR